MELEDGNDLPGYCAAANSDWQSKYRADDVRLIKRLTFIHAGFIKCRCLQEIFEDLQIPDGDPHLRYCVLSLTLTWLSDSGFWKEPSISLENDLPCKDALSVNNVQDWYKTYWTFKYDKQAKSKESQEGKYVLPTLFGYSKYCWNSKTTTRNSQSVTAGVLPKAVDSVHICEPLTRYQLWGDINKIH